MFVLGNGESRLKTNSDGLRLDLNAIKTVGKVYGCNALYRDFTPDALISSDGGMMHEIGASGYAENNLCYFKSWGKLPEIAYDTFTSEEMFEGWHSSLRSENEKGNKKQFVLTGTDPNHIMSMFHAIRRQYEKDNMPFDPDTVRQQLGNHHQWITWVNDIDEVRLIPEVYSAWGAGPIAVRMMLEDYEPSEVYMMGFDMNSNNGKVNNVYKGTTNYVPQDTNQPEILQWIDQHIQNFITYPEVTFYNVLPEWEEVPQWNKIENVEYLSFRDLIIKLDTNFVLI